MSKKLMISCDEATAICDKNQYGEASRWDKFRLSFHLLLCKHCKGYSEQNHIVTKLLGKYLNTCDGSKHLTEAEKEELSKNLDEKLEK
ncbi:hypothetical protein MNBD_BACTEROID02-448 [hydrothermal vent metagenome]|uniref:Zinc-finger domain-containing protein n=1 Tax=hydrothermal vent metagenome TaxID=652676 RepID=A0A3B0QU79_9ZZZZ